MGDLIHILPAVTDAKKAIPEIQFDWVVEETFSEIPGWHEAVDCVIPIAQRRWRKNFFSSLKRGEISRFIKRLKNNHYDYVIDAQGLMKSAWVTWLASGKRCGMDKDSLKEAYAHFFYQQKFAVSKQAHAIERARILFAKALGYSYQKNALDYGLSADAFSKQKYSEPYLVFLHATSRDSKLWDEQQWLLLRDQVLKAGFSIYLPWGDESEKLRAERISREKKHCHVLPKMQLTHLAGVLANATAVVGVDTGLSHLSAALNIPGITLYFDTYPGLTGSCGTQQICLTQMNSDENKINMIGLNSIFYEQILAEHVWLRLNEKLNGISVQA